MCGQGAGAQRKGDLCTLVGKVKIAHWIRRRIRRFI